jgi:hypothetical protein
MKLYKVSWTVKAYVKDAGMPSREETLVSKSKFTLNEDKATTLIKDLEKAAALLGLTKELKTSTEELEID